MDGNGACLHTEGVPHETTDTITAAGAPMTDSATVDSTNNGDTMKTETTGN